MSTPSVSVLFVCLGNICRSPTAEAVFRRRVTDAGLEERIHIDSAGTGDWHIGKAPDRRASAAAARRGYELDRLRARQVSAEDFHRFDLILAMDDNNLADLQALRPADDDALLARFLDVLGEDGPHEVPDPYYGGDDGFDHVLNLVEKASDLWLERLRERL
ncbi:low molecular weight phosphotyrosine protein phosphatase [Alcanivorax marinus]|uniref:protein-tyrosine-phosphatase n=1 Tax=Alloalcanivorax marinus TaxID=1177169 RepID=A0A9Q3ULR8_9GAMM|nr:low molecular weight protein-tyrosine-phosphatase [Alloalcanivorax marinus]MCC4309312.1 low molecular weight phosphotyrosine protein phosphatase [Alloalcanivorax marinus]MCH2557099.1 low molecular weight phosphotyrosine protein phosphatase [Alcanivorax sp.]MCU5788332.1 protein tyrosine phosphatase [Alloalcanivorax marinus]